MTTEKDRYDAMLNAQAKGTSYSDELAAIRSHRSKARFPYFIDVVDRAGSPVTVAYSANPIAAFRVAGVFGGSRTQVSMVGHVDREEWLDEDGEIESWLNDREDEELRSMVEKLTGDPDACGQASREAMIDAIYDALYPPVQP